MKQATDRRRATSAKIVVAVIAAGLLSLAGLAMWIGQSGAPTAKLSELDVSAGTIYTSSFPDTEGKQQSLGQWQHKLLIINFWATWCGPCKEEMPIFAKLQKKYGANGLQIIGIAADLPLNVVNFDKKLNVGYPLLADEARAIEFSKRLGNRLGLLPHTVIVQPGGDVLRSQLGVINEAEFEAFIVQNLPKIH